MTPQELETLLKENFTLRVEINFTHNDMGETGLHGEELTTHNVFV